MTTHSTFIGGNHGPWKVTHMHTVAGESLDWASHLRIDLDSTPGRDAGVWALTGVASNLRYTERTEKEALTAIQAGLGRPEAICAALIPIRKTEAWWALSQDERRHLFEDQSHHIQTGLAYLPAIARKLYHCRDLGGPFDFLTWFEYAPAHAVQFEALVNALRQTREWSYISREIDIRLVRAS
ncbi:chlorite dismutase [Fibrisoma montanum]|uniref:Chlorite dismutase n=1 Tax=Fibrisoma montanum TaxID=2305895 RepID=A0A418MCF8_9BACT|nr:chlorite dismutase family protein [Fibrisoma montanum]RIV24006.1 chlorite dismutase [Fibrisoma montanum]